MTNLKINYSRLIKNLIIIFTCFFTFNISANENDLLEIIENSWNQTKTLSGKFQQKLPYNKFISGNFYIEKPYKSNFTYDKELNNVITTKYFINIINRKGYLLDRYPIVNQPIYKILSENISLKELFKISLTSQSKDQIIVNLISKEDKNNNEAKINLTFNSIDYSLKNWEIIDSLGQSTYLEFTNIRKNISIDKKLFNFKEIVK